jgi:hypothetical protein
MQGAARRVTRNEGDGAMRRWPFAGAPQLDHFQCIDLDHFARIDDIHMSNGKKPNTIGESHGRKD